MELIAPWKSCFFWQMQVWAQLCGRRVEVSSSTTLILQKKGRWQCRCRSYYKFDWSIDWPINFLRYFNPSIRNNFHCTFLFSYFSLIWFGLVLWRMNYFLWFKFQILFKIYIFTLNMWFVKIFRRSNSSISNNSIQHKSTKLHGSKHCYDH